MKKGYNVLLCILELCLITSIIFALPHFKSEETPKSYSSTLTSSVSSPASSATSDTTSTNVDDVSDGFLERYATQDLPLLAQIKAEKIYLYAIKPNGMVLYQNGYGTYFDWTGLSPRIVLPQLSYKDYDKDSKKELAVIICAGTGTGVSINELHMLEILYKKEFDLKQTYKENVLSHDVVAKLFEKKII